MIKKILFNKKYIKQYSFSLLFLLLNSLLLAWNPQITILLIDGAIKNQDLKMFIYLMVIYSILMIAENIFRYISNILFIRYGNNLIESLRISLLEHICGLSGDFFCRLKAGDIISTVYEDTANIKNFITSSIFNLFSDFFIAFPIIIYIIILAPKLLIAIIILYPFLLYSQHVYDKKIYEKSNNCRSSSSIFTIKLQEFVSSILPIALANEFNFYYKLLIEKISSMKLANQSLEVSALNRRFVLNIFTVILSVAVFSISGYQVVSGSLSLGGLTALLQYSGKLLIPIVSINNFRTQYKKTLVSMHRINSLYNESSQVKSAGNLTSPKKFSLNFNDISFNYNENIILKNINLEIKPKQKIAIVGNSGSGKTTIINILLRLWDVQAGEILLNNKNFYDYDLSSYRNEISVVSQNACLFNGTIYENIVLNEINITQEQILSVLKIVELEDLLKNLEFGIETMIGDRGITLSGGQKQRIILARALIKNTNFIILDEATSSLDTITEAKIFKNLKENYDKKTILIITHRVSTLKDCDCIYVINAGEIVEKGKYETLIKNKHFFYDLSRNKVDNKLY